MRTTVLSTPSPTALVPTSAVSPTAVVTETLPGPDILRIWLPPQFDPSRDTLASKLLQNQLNEFVKRQPGIRLEIRIKAVEGPGGMLESLSAASAAAPAALPDLIALPRPVLEAAALKGLLSPFDGLTSLLDDPGWFDYARQLARLQNSTFGIPFAGDAMIMAYRPSITGAPPADWQALLKLGGPLIFPAADPLAYATLNYYQSAGGIVQDNQGRPTLDAAKLAHVLAFYQQAAKQALLPTNIGQVETDDQAWTGYIQNQATMVFTWTSRYLSLSNQQASDIGAAPIPTSDGKPYTLATGWVWALPNHHPDRQALSVQLAEFLTEVNFLASWTSAAGYLPPREQALPAWKDSKKATLAKQIALSAHLVPPNDVLASLAPALRQAVVQMLSQGGDPEKIAQEALKRIGNP